MKLGGDGMKKKSGHKKLWLSVLLGMVVIGVVLISGCVNAPEEKATDEETAEVGETGDWCNAGTYLTMPGYKMKITGIEKHTIEGERVDLCCGEWELSDDGETTKMKYGSSHDDVYGIQWIYDEEQGEYVKIMEIFPKDDMSCVRTFDAEGEITMESCS
jgi:hypothetical protein